MRKEIEILEKFIREKGLRYTPQREEMPKIFMSIAKHFTPIRHKLQIFEVCDKCSKR